MNTLKRWRNRIPSIPPWNMPSDPVKAIWWFVHWLLQILVRFFWLPIMIMVLYEGISNGHIDGIWNGIASGFVTLLVGLVVWAVLYGISVIVNIGTGISKVVSDMRRVQEQQNSFLRQTYNPYMRSSQSEPEREGRVVEGTITDLDEERQKRRHER
ncbi:hypothetical protein [Dictyobacter arantiisoli]|uniref:Uncharacterized protein n=1 Tax=Dictyobacter arantiisoli TaxID=2014874 RepID=A0A5A5TJV2_9CHLR|nr:hypothetical protein [Dictyobacter arantiisoli]GCF11518.1 hypothetical protein KDI_50820 [Dictyobacter arantiisoli]